MAPNNLWLNTFDSEPVAGGLSVVLVSSSPPGTTPEGSVPALSEQSHLEGAAGSGHE